jgi:hypothetical protein
MNQDFYNSEILLLLEARHHAFGICAAITPSNPAPRRGDDVAPKPNESNDGPGTLFGVDKNATRMQSGANRIYRRRSIDVNL